MPWFTGEWRDIIQNPETQGDSQYLEFTIKDNKVRFQDWLDMKCEASDIRT